MPIKALCDYYDKLPEAERQLTRTYINVSYAVDLSEDGEVVRIRSVKEAYAKSDKSGKTITAYRPQRLLFTKRGNTSSICAFAVDHRPRYIFGVDCEKSTLAITKRSRDSHKSFVAANETLFDRAKDPLCRAFGKFVKKWTPDVSEFTKIAGDIVPSDICGSNVAFCLDGYPDEYLNTKKEVLDAFDDILPDDGGAVAQCSISGEYGAIAVTHDPIKGIVGGQMSGCKLVCVNNSAEESYGDKQGGVCKVSRSVMERYTRALNYLVNSDRHRTIIGGMTVVHWADSADEKADDVVNSLAFFEQYDKTDAKETEAMIVSVLEQIRRGEQPDFSAFDVDESVDYYIVGFLPNSSRLAVKFRYRNTLGAIMNNIMRYHGEFAHARLEKAPGFKRLGAELISPKAKDRSIPPDFTGSMFDSMFMGVMYPRSLLEKTVSRVKTDRVAGDIKVGMIKAYLNRKNKKEVITMSLNKDNDSAAYLSGRLFAVLEAVQKNAAGGKLNRTIKDAYFASACSTPAVAFPTLIKLSQSHLKKIESAPRFEKMIGEIVEKFEGAFPKTLSLEQQGEFIVGYYQQNNEIYAKKGEEE